MAKQPLAEVFGFPITNVTEEAIRYRNSRLCPFNNNVPNCTKTKAKDPLGVCSVISGDSTAITCPVRFRQNWVIANHAAEFLFPQGTVWTTLMEVRLNDKHGKSAGNIDVVLVSYDDRGKITDFGALEIQGVYISGNVRTPFEYYMHDQRGRTNMDWEDRPNYPRPDYLSSSRKRLAPQLIFKGGILKTWNKRQAVALDKGFFETLPPLKEVSKEKADICWLIYDLRHDRPKDTYVLDRHKSVYTSFHESLDKITRPDAGAVDEFVKHLQAKLDEKLDTPPETSTLDPDEIENI